MKKVWSFVAALVMTVSLCSCDLTETQGSRPDRSDADVFESTASTTSATCDDATLSDRTETALVTSTEKAILTSVTTRTESDTTANPDTTVEPDTTTKRNTATKCNTTTKRDTTTKRSMTTKHATTTEADVYQDEDGFLYDKNGFAYVLENGSLWLSHTSGYAPKNVTIPSHFNGIPVVGVAEGAFTGVESMESVTFGEGIVTIGKAAFLGCTRLQTVNFSSTVKTIERNAFSDCAITEMTLPDHLEFIGNGAFTQLKVKRLVIPASVRTIEAMAFKWSELEEITIPANVSLGHAMFEQCKNLTTVTLQDGVSGIPSKMFYKCSSLTSINIPDSVGYIGNNAFYGCDKLVIRQLTVRNGAGANIVSGLVIQNVDVYANLTQNSFSSTGIRNLIVHEGVTAIGESAFARAHIGNITLPTTLSTVDTRAFYGTNVDKVVFTGAVSLGHSAFHGSTVKEITLPAGSTLGMYVFSDCKQLETIRYGGTIEQWQKMIQVPNYGHNPADYEELNNATILCSDGTIPPQ